MAHNLKDSAQTFFSGGPGTTGREPFEDSTASGPGAQYSSSNTTRGSGLTGGDHHHHAGRDHQHPELGGIGGGHWISNDLLGGGAGRDDNTRAGALTVSRPFPESDDVVVSFWTRKMKQIRWSKFGAAAATGHDHSRDHVRHTGQSGASGIDELTAGSGTTGISGNRHGTYEHHDSANTGGILGSGKTGTGATATGAGLAGSGAGRHHTVGGRVGSENQGAHLHERTGDAETLTSGAGGTDRFDNDKRRTGAGGVNTGREGYGGADDLDADPTANKSSGSAAGISNTSGPAGNTALTGREGDLSKNPVHQATSRADVTPGTGDYHADADVPHKKGFMEKVKNALT